MLLLLGSHSLFFLLSALHAAPLVLAGDNVPDKIYGVNLGNWLLQEPWMHPQEWVNMGGERCDSCSDCIASEYAFAKAYPDKVDELFEKHWETWFTQDDVDKLVEYGINTVRIPLGFWIVESIVNRTNEFYARGGIKQLKRGLRQLKDAGIKAVLDHHALPGVSTANQMFAGNCTSDVQFYTPKNYHRALVWTAVMTALSHLDPDFASVFSIEAINEPIMDSSKTPGFGDFQKNFVRTVRAVETLLGVKYWEGMQPQGLLDGALSATRNASASLSHGKIYGGEIAEVLLEAGPALLTLVLDNDFSEVIFCSEPASKTPLVTMQTDINWQYNNPPNPADAAIGPQIYDNHLYYAYGWVAAANEEAYLNHSCHLDRIEKDAALGNSPLVFGEWSLATEWTPTDEFIKKWADVQKRAYSRDKGWLFWSFKVEKSDLAGDQPRYWSYFEAVERGYLLPDPTKLHNDSICDPYLNPTTNSTTTNSTSPSTNGTTGGTGTAGTSGKTGTNGTTESNSISTNVTARALKLHKRHTFPHSGLN